jgi:hypothetical protein
MSVSINSGLILGLPYKDLKDIEDIELNDMIHDGDVDISSSYYDSGYSNHNIVGFWLFGPSDVSEVSFDTNLIREKTAEFVKLFGKEPLLFVANNVT